MEKVNDPLVSIIMPAYNCERFIQQAIKSVQNQSMNVWELLVVDDVSTDSTCEIVEEMAKEDTRIHLLRNERNMGPAYSRNRALEKAQGEYVAFLDSDDLWLPEKLEHQIQSMEKSGALFSATSYGQINSTGKDLSVFCIPPMKTEYKKMLALSNPIGNSTVMYNRNVLGEYRVPPIKKRNDFALWLKILKDTPYCMGIDEVLTMYRVRENSISSNKLDLIRYHWQLYYEIENLGLVHSVWYMLCWAWVKGTGRGLNRRNTI